MPPEYAFDVFPANDPAGKISTSLWDARLVRLTIGEQLSEGEGDNYYLHVGHGIGWGRIRIHSDHADATAANLAKRNYVAFMRIDTDPEQLIGGFFLEEGDFRALSDDERGGRLLTFEGPGGLFYLDRYALGQSIYAPGQTRRGSTNIADQWTWSNQPMGAILLRCIEEGFYHPDVFFGAIDTDFTRTRDSNDLLWSGAPGMVLEDYSTPIMTQVLEVYEDLVALGLVVQVDGELSIQAYRDVEEFRVDRTGAFGVGNLRFEAGVNIAIELTQKIAASQERSHIIIRDRIGEYQTVETDLNGDPLGGVPYMATMRSETTADNAAIIRMGQMNLTKRRQFSTQALVRHIIGDDPANGLYAPAPALFGGDYWVLDLGTVHTGTDQHDLNEQDLEVAAIKFIHDEAGNWFAETELGAQIIPEGAEEFRAVTTTAVHAGKPLRLCDADFEVEEEPIGGIGVTGATLTLPDDLPDGAEVGDWIVGQAAKDDGLVIPTIPGGVTPIGSGGTTSSGGGGSVGYRMWKRQLSAGDLSPGNTYVFTNATSLVGALLRGGDPEGAIAGDSIDGPGGSGSVFRVPALVLSDHSGSSRILFMGHHNQSVLTGGSIDDATLLASARGGEHAAWLTEQRSTDYAGDSFSVGISGGWQSHAIEVFGSSIVVPKAGRADLVGTSGEAKRCDDTEHYHAAGSDAPTVDDDVTLGFRIGTLWQNADGDAWMLRDKTEGAAVWVQFASGGGAALDVQEGGASVEDPVDTIDFGAGFDVTTPGAGEVEVALDLLEVSAFTDHSARHEENGADELLVEALGTAEMDTSKRLAPDGAGGLAFAAGGGGGITGIDVDEAGGAAATDVQTIDFGAGFDVAESPAGTATVALDLLEATAFTDHSARHEDGGADEISIAGLAGTSVELAAHLADAADAHDASATSIADAGGFFTGSEVEAALQELGLSLADLVAGAAGPVPDIAVGWDAGAVALTTAVNPIPYAVDRDSDIWEWTILAIPTGAGGTCTIDIRKEPYADYPPESGDSIVASAPPTISSSGVKASSTTLTGWTTGLAKGDTLYFVLTAVSGLKLVTLTLSRVAA